MRHKWILVMCAGVILVQVTNANPVKNSAEEDPTNDDSSESQKQRVPNENKSDENNANEDAAFSTTEASNRQTTTTTEKPSTICTKSGLKYDCILQGIQLSQDESADFGLTWKNNPQKNVTFENSRLAFLPKKLIEAFPLMELLNAEDLQMAEIENGAFDKAVNLKRVYLKNNMITTINHFTGAPQLLHLDLSNNRINHIDEDAFLNNIVLETILLNDNHISELPKTNTVQNLKVLNVANNEIGRVSDHQFSKNNKLENLDVSFNKLSCFNLIQLDNKPVLIIDVSHNKLESIYIPTKVRVLNAANNSIQVLTVNECYAEKLDLSYNQITDVSILQKCSSLKKLDLSHNRLQSFDLNKSFPNLFNLNLAHNHLFEINFPATLHPLQMLDLSYNQLSFGPPNKLKQMKNLKLNNNLFIEFKFDNMKQLNYIEMSNNEWDCGRIKSIMEEKARYVTDAKEVCHGRQSQNGICCKNYSRAFNDRLKEIVRETYIHENENRREMQHCKPAEHVSPGVDNQNIQILRDKVAKLDSVSKKIFDEIEKTKKKNSDISNQISTGQSNKAELTKKLDNYNRVVHKLRENYGVVNEGLVSTKLTLNRVLQFTLDRHNLGKDLLARREQEVKDSLTRFNNLTNTINTVSDDNNNLKEVFSSLKRKESAAKKERQQLEKAANKNSPSLQGSKG